MSIEGGCWYVGANNFGKNRVKRRWYIQVELWWSCRVTQIKLPVSGGSCSGLHIGPLHICWGGWRALNWN